MFQPFLELAFPSLLAYGYIASSFFRVCVAWFWLRIAVQQNNRFYKTVLVILSLLLMFGGFTQIIAILLTIIGLSRALSNKDSESNSDLHALLALATLFLVFNGSGPIGFDMSY